MLVVTECIVTCPLLRWRRLKQAMVREEEDEEDKVRWRVDAELRLRQDELAVQAGAAAAEHSAEAAALRVRLAGPGVPWWSVFTVGPAEAGSAAAEHSGAADGHFAEATLLQMHFMGLGRPLTRRNNEYPPLAMAAALWLVSCGRLEASASCCAVAGELREAWSFCFLLRCGW